LTHPTCHPERRETILFPSLWQSVYYSFEGIKEESPKQHLRALRESFADNRKLNETFYFYHGFWLFARSEAILFCFWWRFVAAGAV
jgi:hypothetical protein